MALSIEQLSTFTTIAKAGSLGRAAAQLNMTQPALSRAIKRLEQQLGAELFERHSKGMQLTDIGRAFLPHATSLHAEASQALEEIQALRGGAKGTVRVGAVASIASSILPPAIERTLTRWPGLHFEVLEGVWDLLAASLSKHEIDLALGAEAPDTDEIVAVRDCYWEDTSYVVVASDHPLRRRRKLTLADTLHEKWTIPPPGTGPHQHVERVFAEQGLGMPDVIVRTRSITVLKSLVVDSGFLSWMAEPMFEPERRAGLIAPLSIAGVDGSRRLVAFRRRRGLLAVPALKLLDELRRLTSAGSRKR
ncbi:LysR family transcriptional regulator [Bradyrhizobium sp. Ce-3]|uniref:LysR family transcriptional regulator n=1 Tax=Bradyrhizobium sp. Ce-3 TaxID=2913970 RepID=UPI001FC82598|nr:LysR family transcriptional regulator [Bradyrhizobium sp. Ce-3]GKQ55147.1 transcriptional regulator [Bradyrhizobium sp. Ce-3]